MAESQEQLECSECDHGLCTCVRTLCAACIEDEVKKCARYRDLDKDCHDLLEELEEERRENDEKYDTIEENNEQIKRLEEELERYREDEYETYRNKRRKATKETSKIDDLRRAIGVYDSYLSLSHITKDERNRRLKEKGHCTLCFLREGNCSCK